MATQFRDCPSRGRPHAWAKLQLSHCEGMQHFRTLQVFPMLSMSSENTCIWICIWKWSLLQKSLHSQKFGSLWLVSAHCWYPHVFANFASRLHGRDNIPTWKRKQNVELICFMDVRELTIKQGMFSSIVNYTNKSNSLGILNCSPWPCFISCHSKMCLSTQLRWATTLTRTSTQDNNSNGFEGSMSLISRPHSWEPPRLNQVQKLPPFQPLLQPSGCWSLGRLNFCSSENAMLIRPSFEDGKIRYLEPANLQHIVGEGLLWELLILNFVRRYTWLDWAAEKKTAHWHVSEKPTNIQHPALLKVP